MLLTDHDNLVARSSGIPFLQNDFQRFKYAFILMSKALSGLVTIHSRSVTIFTRYCTNSTVSLYRTKIIQIDRVPTQRKRKRSITNHVNNLQLQLVEVVQPDQPIEQLDQNQVVIADFENMNNQTDVNLIPSLQIRSNQNDELNIINKDIGGLVDLYQQQSIVQHIEIPRVSEIPPLPSTSLHQHFMNPDAVPPNDVELLQSVEQPRYPTDLQEQPVQTEHLQLKDISDPQNQLIQVEQLPVQSKDIEHVQKATVAAENNVSVSAVPNQPVKRKSLATKRSHKKKPTEQSSRVLITRKRKLEGEFFDRPLEIIREKHQIKTLTHLPLRYATDWKRSNQMFSSITMMKELKNNDTEEDNLDTIGYKKCVDELNRGSLENIIYHQATNYSLPHLAPLVEDCSSNNSLEWRHTINEINRKLGDNLKDTSPIFKIDFQDYQDYQDRLKNKVHQSLIAQKTLIGPEISHVDAPLDIVFPLHQTEELFLNKSLADPRTAPEMLHANIESNQQLLPQRSPAVIHNETPKLLIPDNQLVLNNVQNFQKNVEPDQTQSIDVMQMLTNIFIQYAEVSCLKFTDLCPLLVTKRKKSLRVLLELLEQQEKGVIQLSQPYDTSEPSSISVELIN